MMVTYIFKIHAYSFLLYYLMWDLLDLSFTFIIINPEREGTRCTER